MTIPVPPEIREACENPDFSAVQTIGQLAAYSVAQAGEIASCESSRAAAVDLLDAYNGKPEKPWWRVW